MINKKIVVTAFLEWFKNDQHSGYEDIYSDIFKQDYLENLSEEKFIEFFKQFAKEGGKIQSGGARTASKFIDNVKTNFQDFKFRIIEPFGNDFDFKNWLIWAVNFNYLGQGLATIILNRIDKKKYVIVNNKSVAGLKKLGFTIPEGNFFKKYNAIEEGEKALLAEFPELENLYRVDALMHFIIGTDEGIKLTNSDLIMDYFDLNGFKTYASNMGGTYNPKDPATNWWKDTRTKLEYLVKILRVRLDDNISINYTERPNARSGKGNPFILKNYILTGFSPDKLYPKGELFVKLAFHNLNSSPVFDIEFDYNNTLSKKPYASIVSQIKGKYRKQISVGSDFPKDWDSLMDTIQEDAKIHISEYRKIVNKIPVIKSSIGPMNSLNTILYGPPGTGKTYRTVDHALSIIDGKSVTEVSEEREINEKAVKEKFDKYVKDGRIVFCTFHQSMGYEDFIEGIKPLPPNGVNAMQYDVIDGIFKKLNIEAIYQLATKTGGKKITETLDFAVKYDLFVESVQERWSKGETVELLTKSGGKILLTDVSRNNYLIFNHPGSDRPVLVSKPRLSELSSEIADLSKVNNIDKHFRSIIGGMDSTAYWASLNGIRNFQNPPETEILNVIDIDYADKKSAILNFKIEDGKEICENADKFVLIIDEINRGNIAQIFGELITLIEEDKRKGCKNNISVTLPYSGESFEVAPNLYIIGTMNTADRSVEALDTALRRRFSFVEMEPLPGKLNEDIDGINLILMLETINARLEILLDKDHTIGHAWLMDVIDIIGLRQKFENKIIPLLKEFFYNEIEKIGLVLGGVFFVSDTSKKIELSKFKPAAEIATEYKNKIVSKLRPIKEINKEDFISIYKINE